MGADLILTYCEVPRIQGAPLEFTNAPKFDDYQPQILARVQAANLEDPKLDWDPWDYDDEVKLDKPTIAMDCAHQVWTCAFYHSRETCIIRIANRYYAFHGGTSWGDNPSDEYDAFWLIRQLGIFRPPFEKVG